MGAPQQKTRHQLRPPSAPASRALKGARYGARSPIRRADRNKAGRAARFLRRDYEYCPYLAGSPPHPASLVLAGRDTPKRRRVRDQFQQRGGGAPFRAGIRLGPAMHSAQHYRERAARVRTLASSDAELALREQLESMANDYDEIADELEVQETKTRHS